MTLTLRIEHSNGTTNTLDIVGSDVLGNDNLPSLNSVRKERSVLREPDQTDQCTVAVFRAAWNEIRNDLDNIDDKFFVAESGTDIFGGRLNDWEFDDSLVSVKLHGPKADALGATPSGGAEVYQPQADDTLLKNELLSRVGTVGQGTITQQNGSIAFEESHSSPGKSITKLAETTGSETVYQPDFTLDYVDSLGSDRTGTTLSPSNQNVLGSPRIQRREKEDFTHIRVLGSQSGSTQFLAERTINSNTTRQKWGLYTDKDAQSQGRVDALADEIQSELQSGDRHIEVEIGLAASVNPSIGDEFSVKFPDYDIDTTLRALRVTRIVDEDGDRYSCLLTNRRLARELQGERQARATDSFDSGNPGQYYALADGEGWDAVDNGEPYEFSFYRPGNTIAEYRAVLQLESREYRLRASQTGHNHSVDIPNHNHDVSISDSSTSTDNSNLNTVEEISANQTLGSSTPVTFSARSFSDSASYAEFVLTVDFTYVGSNDTGLTIQLLDGGSNIIDSVNVFDEGNGQIITHLFDYSNPQNTSYDIEIDEQLTSGSGNYEVDARVEGKSVGKHTHDVSISDTSTTTDGGATTETTTNVDGTNPGINTIAGEQVSNVAVDIGGTTVASGLSAPIDETIDISGVLADGSNNVTIASDSLGELRATVEYEGLKNANK